MRTIAILVFGTLVAASGCGDDSGSAGSGGSGGSSGAGGSGGSGGIAPIITMIAWETTPTCSGASDYTVTVSVSDPDTNAEDLVFSGSVGGCTGSLDAAVSTINCPNVAPYPGTVMVTDDDGNESAPVAFDIGVCESASCTTDPNTCG